MTSQQVVEAVEEWLLGVVTGLAGSYTFIPNVKSEALPDAIVDIADVGIVDRSVEFPMQSIQQQWIHFFRVEVSFMVENTDAEAAAEWLRAAEGETTASLLQDGTLAGRVDFVSPFISYDFTPPFVEYDDGTRGREMIMRVTVGEFVEAAA